MIANTHQVKASHILIHSDLVLPAKIMQMRSKTRHHLPESGVGLRSSCIHDGFRKQRIETRRLRAGLVGFIVCPVAAVRVDMVRSGLLVGLIRDEIQRLDHARHCQWYARLVL